MDRIIIKQFAQDIRKEIINAAYNTGNKGIHYGPALSLADFLAVVYGGYFNISPDNASEDNRDRFILSKGHAYTALYSTLALKNFFSLDEYHNNFMTDGGIFPAHPVKQLDKGIECSTGSLGMGLSFAVGKALNAKRKNMSYKVIVAMGDGECDEGSTYEAFSSAAQFHLDNLIVFIDHNGFQQDGTTHDVMNINLCETYRSLGCEAVEINGNDIDQIIDLLENHTHSDKPLVIIGNTVKGKGISFMENVNIWHHASLNEEQYNQAMSELQ